MNFCVMEYLSFFWRFMYKYFHGYNVLSFKLNFGYSKSLQLGLWEDNRVYRNIVLEKNEIKRIFVPWRICRCMYVYFHRYNILPFKLNFGYSKSFQLGLWEDNRAYRNIALEKNVVLCHGAFAVVLVLYVRLFL